MHHPLPLSPELQAHLTYSESVQLTELDRELDICRRRLRQITRLRESLRDRARNRLKAVRP